MRESGIVRSVEIKESGDSFDLQKMSSDVADSIIREQNIDRINDLTNLFNLNIKKKNILRILTYNNLMDKVDQQLIDRVSKHPDEISNKDLLDIISTIEQCLDRAQKSIEPSKIDIPLVQINNQTLNINSDQNENKLNKQERDQLIEFINSIMRDKESGDNKNIIDIDISEK